MIKAKRPEPKVRVIRDCRDGSRDVFLPPDVAKSLYEAGHLDWDLTNRTYCTPEWESTELIEAIKKERA